MAARRQLVVVIGAGHNGLVAALRLASIGRKVIVIEAAARAGGLCSRREFHDGYSVPGLLHDQSTLSRRVVEELGLESRGLFVTASPTPTFAPELGASGISLDTAGLRALGSSAEAAGFEEWQGQLSSLGRAIAPMLEGPPPALHPRGLNDWWQLVTRGFSIRRRGRDTMLELMRLAPMCVADWLGEYLKNRSLIEMLAAPAVENSFAGPWSAGTALNLLLTQARTGLSLTKGPASLIDVLVESCEDADIEIRCQSPVERVLVENGEVRAVRLVGGDDISCTAVLATCDPKQALLDLIEPGQFELRFEDAIRNLRGRGSAAKMHIALAAPLELVKRSGEHWERLRIGGGDIDMLERAFDDCKYGNLPTAPHLDVRLPSIADPSLAPDGHQVASVLVSFVAPKLVGEPAKQAITTTVLDILARQTPDIRERIVATEVVLPADIRDQYRISGGHLHHLEPALDQLVSMRPTAETSSYRTPIRGLYLGGSGCHPGGGVSGAPGWLAAKAVATHEN